MEQIMNTDQYTIKDLENLSGIKAHTIRIWEQRYGFLKPNRTDTNIRYYSSKELKTLLNVSLLNKYGYKVSHINKLNEDELQEKILGLSKSNAEQEFLINSLVQHMIEVKPELFESVINTQIQTKGLERTITYLIFPFLERVGFLWVTNHIKPAQEHIITAIIRQKLLVGIEKTPAPIAARSSVVCFLPDHEYHEIGLLFVHYLLRINNIKVIYMGCSVPVEDIRYIAERLKPNYLYTHLTSVGRNFNFEKFSNTVATAIPDVPLVVSGSLIASYNKKTPPSIHLKESYKAVTEFIESLK